MQGLLYFVISYKLLVIGQFEAWIGFAPIYAVLQTAT